MSALLKRTNGIIPLTPAADYSTKAGYGVTFSGTTATVSASATTPITGVILEGSTTSYKSTVALLGVAGTCNVKLSGTVTAGAFLQQHTDGSFVTDAGTGQRTVVGIALESGVSGDLIEAQLLGAPVVYAS